MSPTLGYEIDGIPQLPRPRVLVNSVLNCPNSVTYIPLTTIGETITPLKALRLNNTLYLYNTESGVLEEEDVITEGVDIINANTGDAISFDKNTFVRKNTFDCIRESDQQDGTYQPIQGLEIDSAYQTIKTQTFNNNTQEPKYNDLIQYKGRFWIIEEIRKTFIYTPKEKSTLHISLKAIR